MNDAELLVIGSILIEPQSINKIYNMIRPEMFSEEIGQTCYREMLYMYDNGQDISIVGLTNRMDNGRIDMDYFKELIKQSMTAVISPAYIKSYAEEIVRQYQSSKVKEIISRVSVRPKDIQNSIAEMLVALEHLTEHKESTCKYLKTIVAENRSNYFVEKQEVGVKTGFYKLDDLIGALEPGDVTVIGARPAVGKSALVAQIVLQIAGKGKRIGYFNLEMSESQIFERMVSQTAPLSLTRVRRAKKFLGDEEQLYNNASDKLTEYDVVISSGGKSISQVRQESRHANFDVIIIDYLQLVKADRKYGNRASEVGDISKAIKSLAMELKIPIILLSQLNRASEGRDTKEPSMSELRESGDIEQDASNIILLWNLSNEYKSYKGLKIEKNRQGELGKIGMKFIGDNMKFVEAQEDFEKFEYKVKSLEKKKNDFTNCNDDCPFE